MPIKFRLAAPPQSSSPWRKLLAGVIALALFVPLLMFSAAVLIILLVISIIAGGIFWWKTRQIRQQMRSFTPPTSTVMEEVDGTGEIIEGEVIRVVRTRDEQ
ncbi:MAG: hypothetical protein PHI11_04885 [Gallionella sp.]|nr:hypothetical protein [Gallionella sp.]